MRLFKYFDLYFKLGIQDDMPHYLKGKIYLSNQIGVIVGFVLVFPFIFITYFLFKPITYIPVLAFVFSVSIPLISGVGAVHFARFANSVTVFLCTTIYNAYLCQEWDTPVLGIYMIALSNAVTPFLVFDLKEKKRIIPSMVVIFIVFLSYNYLNKLLDIPLDTTLIRTGYLATVTVIISITTVSTVVYLMSYFNNVADSKSEELILKMEEQFDQIRDSEEQLKNNIAEIEKNQEEEKKRVWVTNGLAKIGDMLRVTGSNSQSIFDNVISTTVKHLSANQGGLFVINDIDPDDIIIELKACYAYARKKFTEKTISPGVGLIGQCYYEKSLIHLTDIPNNYVNITSGLGEATPNSLVIIPLIVNDEIEGFIEIASFNYFDKHHLEFLNKLGENIATYIKSNKISEQTNALLEESKENEERLKVQEEELRQNLEEIEATKEELSRKEKRYLTEIEHLNTELKKFSKLSYN